MSPNSCDFLFGKRQRKEPPNVPPLPDRPEPGQPFLERLNLERNGVLFAFAFLLLLATVVGWPYFHQPQNLINIMRQASYTGIIALAMTYVIISGGIDLSVGSMAAFVGSCGVLFMNHRLAATGDGYGLLALSFAAMLALGALCGLANGALVAYGRIVPFIVTLGTMSIFRNLAKQLANAGEFQARSRLFGHFGMSAVFSVEIGGTTLSLPTPVFALLLLAGILSFFLNDTRYGRYLRAVGSNAKVAEYSAIRVPRIRLLAYVVNGALVGISAFLLAGRFSSVSTPNFGLEFELDAIAAVIIGGTAMSGGRGTVWGTVLGCFMLQIIQNMLNMAGMSPYLQGIIKGIVIIVSVFIQKQKQS